MDENIVEEILQTLLSSLEALDTQTTALMQYVKAKGIATEEELAPFLEQSGNASNVRWRAAKVRMSSLLAAAAKSAKAEAALEAQKAVKKQLSKPTAEATEKPAEETAGEKKEIEARRRTGPTRTRGAEGADSRTTVKTTKGPAKLSGEDRGDKGRGDEEGRAENTKSESDAVSGSSASTASPGGTKPDSTTRETNAQSATSSASAETRTTKPSEPGTAA